MSMRAFDLVQACYAKPFLGQDEQLSTLECTGNTMYIGSTLGRITSFSFHEIVDAADKTTITSEFWSNIQLTTNKPVLALKSASALDRILALCDGWLHILTMNLEDVGNGPKMKWVTCLGVNTNPQTDDPFVIQMALGTKKKQVLVCEIVEDNFKCLKEIATQDSVVSVGFDGNCLCYATDAHYYLHDVKTGNNQSLFPYSNSDTMPVICRIAKEEFLLSGPNSLGMFISGEGVSNRPPLVLSDLGKLLSVVHCHPYILALTKEKIGVFSSSDHQLKQVISISDGVFMGNFDGQIFLASTLFVFTLSAVSWDKQVQALLVNKQVEEALDLAQSAHKVGVTKENFLKVFRRLQQQSAFIKIEERKWTEAKKLCIDGRIDLREVISLFPDLLPSTSNFIRCTPPLHNMPDIRHITVDDSGSIRAAQDFLLQLLQTIRNEPWTRAWKSEIDTAYAKLICLLEPDRVQDLFAPKRSRTRSANVSQPHHHNDISDISIDVSDCAAWLEKHGYYHALALTLINVSKLSEAIAVWKKLLIGNISDENFPGLQHVINFLKSCEDVDVVISVLDWFLKNDHDEAVLEILETYEWINKIDSADIVRITTQSPLTQRAYLENLVLVQKSTDKLFHTQLMEGYLEEIRTTDDSSASAAELRRKLAHLLKTSDMYDLKEVLSTLECDPKLKRECAVVYGRLKDHEKALSILVKECSDCTAAENYCAEFAKTMPDRNARKALYHLLIRIYSENKTDKNDFLLPTLRLLNSPNAEIDLTEVFQSLPEYWTVSAITPCLKNSVLGAMTSLRRSKLLKSASESVSLRLRNENYELSKQSITIAEHRLCPVCQTSFLDSNCFIYPNHTVVHKECVKDPRLCPVTGQVFTSQYCRKSDSLLPNKT